MRNKLFPLLAILTLLLTPLQSFADKGGSPNEHAYKNASENAVFKRDGKDKDKDKEKEKDKDKDKDNEDKKNNDKDKKED